MRRSGGHRVNKILLLCLWLVASCVGYAVQLHVTVAHADEHHPTTSHPEHSDSGHSADEHGISSAAQSLGISRAAGSPGVVLLGRVLTIVIAGGFFIIPIYTFILSKGVR